MGDKKTDCVYCGRVIDWDPNLFESGLTGEPACPQCFNQYEICEEEGEDK